MTPEEEQELAELEELERLEAEVGGSAPPARAAQPPGPDAAKAAELAPLLSPAMPIAPQVLATQPATTHPGGDEAAQADWVVKGTDSAKGATVVYEPPLKKAREELLSNPQLLAALYPDEPITPEEIAAMDESSDIYKTYADHKWNEVRWAAADSGTTAYRHAKMPWLQGGAAGLSPLHTLVTKVRGGIDPAIEGANAFLMGVDDTATFGATKRTGEAIDRNVLSGPSESTPIADAVRGASATGGVSGEANAGAAPEAVNEMLAEENPKLHTAGQIAGLFTPGGVMGLLGKAGAKVVAGAGRAAEALGAGSKLTGAAKLGGAGASAIVGGGAASLGRDAVDAGFNAAKTGEAGTTLDEAGSRAADAALDPMNLALGVGGEAAGMAARAGAKAIANSPRYGGNIERIKQLGGKFGFGKGPMGTKETDAAIAAGKKRDITPVAVMAEELAPKIAAAENELAAGNLVGAKAAKDAIKQEHAQFKKQYFESKEGSQVLPPVATMEANLKHLRSKMTPEPGGGIRPVGNAEGVATARAEFSGDVAKVSLEPVKGAIELSPDEAEMFLSPALTHDLVPKPKAPPPAPPAPPAPGVNKQGVNVIKPPVGEAPTVPPKGREAKAAGKVEAIPDRDLKPTFRTEATNQGMKEQEVIAEARPGLRKDAEVGRKLDAEFSAELSDAEASALNNAKSSLGALRKRTPDLDAALEKTAVDNPGTLYKGARMPQAEVDKILKDGLSVDKHTVSSVSQDVADTFAAGVDNNVPVLMQIEGTPRASIAHGYKGDKLGNEKTAFIPPGSKYEVVKSEKYTTKPEQEWMKPEEGVRITLRARAAKPGPAEALAPAARSAPKLDVAKVKKLTTDADKVADSLSEAEVDAVRSYTSRKGDKVGTPEWGSAVKKLTVQNPTDAGTLFHGTRMPKEQIDALLKSGKYATKEPTSLSFNKDLSDAFSHGREARGDKVLFEVQGLKEGQAFTSKKLGIGRSGLEREINLAKPTKFEVVGSSVDDEGVTHIILRDLALGGLAVGGAAATGDTEGGAMGAAAGGLALALKKRGVSKVYVVPRRYNAQQHEVRIGQLKDLTKDPKMPGAREAKERYAAALQDRGQRSLDGKPGGWSEKQQAISEQLTALEEKLALADKAAKTKGAAQRDAPGGTANSRLVRYSKQRDNELPLKKEIEDAGARAGVLPQLQNLRLLDPLEQLTNSMSYRGKTAPRSKSGLVGAMADMTALRFAYPGLDAAGSLQGGSMSGVRMQQLIDDEKRKAR